jgi:hypothetical protein
MTRKQFIKYWTPDVDSEELLEAQLEALLKIEWDKGFTAGLKKAEEAVSMGRKLMRLGQEAGKAGGAV